MFKSQAEKDQAVRSEISSLIDAFRAKIRYARQYPVSKTRTAELEKLGVLEYMPEGFQNSDAQAVIEAAKQTRSGVMNAYGEGEEIPASDLNKILNTGVMPDEDDPAENGIGGGDEPDYAAIYADICAANYTDDDMDMQYDTIKNNNTDWYTGIVDKSSVKAEWQEFLQSRKRGKELLNQYKIVQSGSHVSKVLLEKPEGALYSVLANAFLGYHGSTAPFYFFYSLVRR